MNEFLWCCARPLSVVLHRSRVPVCPRGLFERYYSVLTAKTRRWVRTQFRPTSKPGVYKPAFGSSSQQELYSTPRTVFGVEGACFMLWFSLLETIMVAVMRTKGTSLHHVTRESPADKPQSCPVEHVRSRVYMVVQLMLPRNRASAGCSHGALAAW